MTLADFLSDVLKILIKELLNRYLKIRDANFKKSLEEIKFKIDVKNNINMDDLKKTYRYF